MVIPYFVADSARVTILRPLASSAFGSYSLTLPEGIDLEDVHDFEAPGNELGHVATLTRSRRVGGLARRFVRADVAVTAADAADPDWFPESNVDAVLEEASTRVSSDFFLESDITKAGLGPWGPFVDFKVGDKARVNIWGHVVTLPITRIEPIISDHDVVDWLVHLGGQLVSDDDAREVENETLRKAFLQDRRELAGLEIETAKAVAVVDQKAAVAQSTADTAKNTAEGVEQDLHTTHVEPVEEGWYPTEEGWQGATETLNKNFLDFVSFQQDTNQRMQERVDEHERLIKQLQEAKTRALASTTRIIAGGPGTTLDHDGEFIRLTINGRDLTVEALGDWSGDIILNAVRARTDTGEYATGEIPSPYQLQWRIPHPDYSRERIFTIPTTGPYTEWISAMVIAQIRPGTMIEELVPLTKLLPDRDTWDTVSSFTTLTTGVHTIIAVVEWDKTTWQDTYGMHILANGNLLATTGVRTRVGPLVSIGDGGRRRWVLDVQDIHLDEGTEITLQVWAGAPGETQRRIYDGELRVWWIDTGEENNTIEEIP